MSKKWQIELVSVLAVITPHPQEDAQLGHCIYLPVKRSRLRYTFSSDTVPLSLSVGVPDGPWVAGVTESLASCEAGGGDCHRLPGEHHSLWLCLPVEQAGVGGCPLTDAK